ncbi:Rnase Y domain-containing protein, partial [uncultured Clostridium sp.]|uniref:Rnase Y domain-containing protein n=1 Tax=uncultured Clostridium sp. TaxID=59620 RepID=UPI0026290DF9
MDAKSQTMLIVVCAIVIVVLVGIFVVIYTRKNISQANIAKSEKEAKKILDDSAKDAETRKKEAILEAKEEVHRLRTDLEKESRERR